MMIRKLFLASVLFSNTFFAHAADSFFVQEIQFNGLNRMKKETAIQTMSIQIDKEVDKEDIATAIKLLFASGEFEDIKISHKGKTLIVYVVERPIISKIDLPKKIEANIRPILRAKGFEVGRPFDEVQIAQLKTALQQQWYMTGKYLSEVTVIKTPLSDNRVSIKLDIIEEDATKLRQINFIGNRHFSNKELVKLIKWPAPFYVKLFAQRNHNLQEISSNLIDLTNFYKKRGYINFNIEGVQSSLTPDKKSTFLTIYLVEGDRYKIADVKLKGDLPPDQVDAINKLITIKTGDIYNSVFIDDIEYAIKQLLADQGYHSPDILITRQQDEKTKTVSIHFLVKPGNRSYVRYINFMQKMGDSQNLDSMLRGRLSQMEGSWLNRKLQTADQRKLSRHYDKVDLMIQPVPGESDKIDIIYDLFAMNQNKLMLNFTYGFTSWDELFNLNNGSVSATFNKNNFLGTGSLLEFSGSLAKSKKSLSINYNDPFFTDNGMSFELGGLWSKQKKSSASSSSDIFYQKDELRLNTGVSVPIIDENLALSMGLRFQNSDIFALQPQLAALRYLDILKQKKHKRAATKDNDFTVTDISATLGLTYNSLNNYQKPTAGIRSTIHGAATFPGSTNQYYKLGLEGAAYLPLTKAHDWILSLKGGFNVMKGFNDKEPPFYENYFAGGILADRSIRGLSRAGVGPKVILGDESGKFKRDDDDPAGGNMAAAFRAALILPTPFVPKQYVRTSLFFDSGTVWDSYWQHTPEMQQQNIPDYSQANWRASIGISTIITLPIPIVPVIEFAVAMPIKIMPGDKVKTIDFALGIQANI